MYYAIDFDTRSVDSKSKNGELLLAYVVDNGLTTAVAIVNSEDELQFQFGLGELQDLANNLGSDKKYKTEEEAARACWSLLEENKEHFPLFSKGLGEELLKVAPKRCKDVPSKKAEPKGATVKNRKTPSRAARKLDSAVFILGDEEVNRKTAKGILRTCIEDNIGEATFEELVSTLDDALGYDEKKSSGYIRSAINKDIIRISE